MSDDSPGTGPEVVLKPDALLALHSVTEELFETLRRWFHVPTIVPLDLTDIDAVVREMSDPVMIAALAMRKLQARAPFDGLRTRLRCTNCRSSAGIIACSQ